MKWEKWQADKWKHFYVGFILGGMLQIASVLLSGHLPFHSLIASTSALVAICYGFELFSLITGKGHYEMMDALAGIAGGVIGITLIFSLSVFI